MIMRVNAVQKRRLQDRIETLINQAIATHDPDDLEDVIWQLREALQEHATRMRQLAVALLNAGPKRASSQNVPVAKGLWPTADSLKFNATARKPSEGSSGRGTRNVNKSSFPR
jgi:hypothetical protein